MKIAVSGKGGAGKTTVATNLVHCFVVRGYSVFAVDADPDANLGWTLGFAPAELALQKPLIELHDVIAAKHAGGGVLVDLNPDVTDVLTDYTLRRNGVSLLKMGAVKQAGTACYCKENSFLNAVLATVLLERPEAVVLDMSAGIEHLTRGTARGVKVMLVVAEPTRAGLQTALAVEQLARDLEIPEVLFIGNKICSEDDRAFLASALPDGRIVGMIPSSEKVLNRARGDALKFFTGADLLPGFEAIFAQISRGW